jgi:hypothetical protein
MSASARSGLSSAVAGATLVFVLAAAHAVVGQMRQLPMQVAAREGTVLEFGSAVARELTPVGIVLLERDARPGPTPRARADEQEAGGGSQDVEAAASIFHERHPAYRVERTDRGAILIAPRSEGAGRHLTPAGPRTGQRRRSGRRRCPRLLRAVPRT